VIPFRSPAEILGKLELSSATSALFVGAPPELDAIVARAPDLAVPIQSVAEGMARSVKDRFDFILLWQESRIGSRAALEEALKRLLPGGRIWVVTARRKVQGPRTPAAHRLELEDLVKAFAKEGMVCDREARVSAWHTAYGFVRPDPSAPRGR
jgi:hypothetical protein